MKKNLVTLSIIFLTSTLNKSKLAYKKVRRTLILIVVGVVVFTVSKSKKERNLAIINSAWNDYDQNRPTEAFDL